jgi:PQQ-like domain
MKWKSIAYAMVVAQSQSVPTLQLPSTQPTLQSAPPAEVTIPALPELPSLSPSVPGSGALPPSSPSSPTVVTTPTLLGFPSLAPSATGVGASPSLPSASTQPLSTITLPTSPVLQPVSPFGQGTGSASSSSSSSSFQVTTHHYDNFRTGWNENETAITPANAAQLTLKHSVAVDEQVDAQPLYVNGTIYVATENNSIYAIDPVSGAVRTSRNLGTPVPFSALPGSCTNNSMVVGIASTPVVDTATGTMYLIAYTYESNAPVYRIHALDLNTLADKITPVVIAASGALSNNSTYNFNPAVSRQRTALLLSGNNVYAGFSSFCDLAQSASRGWVLGWNASTLAPLAANYLVDAQPPSFSFFLSSVWMSGAGIAADPSGNIYFATGNSAPGGASYSSTWNLEESIVKMSGDLTTVFTYFTPSDPANNVGALDTGDEDFGAGGVMLFPDQFNGINAAVVAGKAGLTYLVNRDSMGAYDASGTNHVLGTFNIGFCSCAPSYYHGSDGVARVVTSGGNFLKVWQVATSPSLSLTEEGAAVTITTGQDGGFFTSVSSNGQQNAVIWAVGRPTNTSPANVTLYAFDPTAKSSPLLAVTAGTWPNSNANANIVPVVANGQVYVASYKNIDIFGLP